LLFLDIDFNLDELIEHYFEPVSSYSGWYTFNTAMHGANRILMFRHSYGPKWSAFLKQYIASIIKSATGIEPEVTIEDGLVTFISK